MEDANGCIIKDSATINEPALLESTYEVTNVTCNAGNDASINFEPNGGTLPYSFLWSNSEITEDIDNLTAGGYSVQLTDANGCKIIPPVIIGISEPDSIKIDSFNIDCPIPGSGVSEVTIVPEGGALDPYQISYDNGNTFNTIGEYSTNLPLDNIYSIIIKDTNECISHIADTISINPQIIIDSINYQKCFAKNENSGEVQVFTSGGNGGLYSISYNNGGTFSTSGNYSDNLLIDNSYIIIAKDSLDCLSAPDTINIPDSIHIDAFITSNYNLIFKIKRIVNK